MSTNMTADSVQGQRVSGDLPEGHTPAQTINYGLTAVAIGVVLGGGVALSIAMDGAVRQLSLQFLLSVATAGIAIVLCALLERRAPAGPQKSIAGWVINLRILMLSYLVAQFAGALSAYATAALAKRFGLGWIDLSFASGKGVIAAVAAFLLFMVVSDFFYYWQHRFQHKSTVLWQQHKLHHMDPQMNATTEGRTHWLKSIIRIPFVIIPTTLVLKADPVLAGAVGGILGVITHAWIVFYHSNIRLHLGRASVLVLGPQVHRIHHSRLPQHRDRNFSGYFPIWDVLFGTYYAPAPEEFPPTGVEGEREVESFVEVVILPFREWWRMFRAWRGRQRAPV